MKIAVIGSGIAGNVAARKLHRHHDITVYESGDHVGGHAHTHDVRLEDRDYRIDTGFIVCNDRTYPNFIALLDELDVPLQKTRMSFSSRCDISGIEYNGSSLNGLFSQRLNLARPRFLGMIADIIRFNREATEYLCEVGSSGEWTLGDYLSSQGYSQLFIDNYIIPMGAAIWSTDPVRMFDFPAMQFIRFFNNHGLLSIRNRPQWYSIAGGSRQYVDALVAPFRDRIRVGVGVERVDRQTDSVRIHASDGTWERYDAVFIACHSDQALKLIDAPTDIEQQVLASIPYTKNEVILHTDTSLLPRNRRSWAAWNYCRRADNPERVSLTYNMNILQNIHSDVTFCVTLNAPDLIDQVKIITRVNYDHPQFSLQGVNNQKLHSSINGTRRTWYCGAYWRYGFHEDGVASALESVEQFNQWSGDEESNLRRAG